MRQRRVKNEAERLAALAEYTVDDGKSMAGHWNKFLKSRNPGFNGKIYFEPGCGRGNFLVSRAKAEPSAFFLGAEGRKSVALRALQKIQEEGVSNALCLVEMIDRVEDYFCQGELSGIYINFCDPWPKSRHAMRRLTHRRYLKGYRQAVVPGGFIEIKTDSDDLFDFTLSECEILDLKAEECTRDLHDTLLPARLFTTLYENRFLMLEKTIKYVRIKI